VPRFQKPFEPSKISRPTLARESYSHTVPVTCSDDNRAFSVFSPMNERVFRSLLDLVML
jgi:hypothetical protein